MVISTYHKDNIDKNTGSATVLIIKSVTAIDTMNGESSSLRNLGVLIKAKITRKFNKAPAMDRGAARSQNVTDCSVEKIHSVLFDNNEQYPSTISPGQYVVFSPNF